MPQGTIVIIENLIFTKQQGDSMSLRKTKVARSIILAMGGSALAAGFVSNAQAAATTMYNTYNAFAVATPTDGVPPGGAQFGLTDGWVWGGLNGSIGFTAAQAGGLAGGAGAGGFVGIGGSSSVSTATPFGYLGSAPVNWAVEFTSATDAATISQADAFSRYGVYADIDTAKGAWADNGQTGSGGWRHNLDFGLFRSAVDTDVHVHLQGLTLEGSRFGFTIFKGMDQSTVGYNHHGDWNLGNNTQNGGAPTVASLPGGGSDFDPDGAGPLTAVGSIVAYSIGGATPTNLNDIIFHAEANQVYTIVLGGFKDGTWLNTADGYVATITAVPVPAAVWLLGSALAGMGVIGRRRQKSAA